MMLELTTMPVKCVTLVNFAYYLFFAYIPSEPPLNFVAIQGGSVGASRRSKRVSYNAYTLSTLLRKDCPQQPARIIPGLNHTYVGINYPRSPSHSVPGIQLGWHISYSSRCHDCVLKQYGKSRPQAFRMSTTSSTATD